MSSRRANENRYKQWTEDPDGNRTYSRKVQGEKGGYALYIKKVGKEEGIISFRQEIYNANGRMIEIHEKYPIDKGHQTIPIK